VVGEYFSLAKQFVIAADPLLAEGLTTNGSALVGRNLLALQDRRAPRPGDMKVA